jgi:hypothetical protein
MGRHPYGDDYAYEGWVVLGQTEGGIPCNKKRSYLSHAMHIAMSLNMARVPRTLTNQRGS